MIEVELKYRLDAPEDFLIRLTARGAVRVDESQESDLYYAHPARDFAKTGEALRIRRANASAALTYKGPLLDRISKSREECEAQLKDLDNASEAARLLDRLGFLPMQTVDKHRTTFRLKGPPRDVTVTIDEVAGLGVFTELESLADEADWESARDDLADLGAKLGLANPEQRSYLELLIEAQEQKKPG